MRSGRRSASSDSVSGLVTWPVAMNEGEDGKEGMSGSSPTAWDNGMMKTPSNGVLGRMSPCDVRGMYASVAVLPAALEMRFDQSARCGLLFVSWNESEASYVRNQQRRAAVRGFDLLGHLFSFLVGLHVLSWDCWSGSQ